MGYEINVALNGKHLFATHERSITYIWELERVLPIFVEKFPKSEGYEISVEHWEKTGKIIDIDSIIGGMKNG